MHSISSDVPSLIPIFSVVASLSSQSASLVVYHFCWYFKKKKTTFGFFDYISFLKTLIMTAVEFTIYTLK